MKTKNIVLITILVACLLGIGLMISPHNRPDQTVVKVGHHEIWYCPMHPHYTSDHPGSCPICGMTLVKKEESRQEPTTGVEGYMALTESAQRQQLMGLRTQMVEIKPIVITIRTVGTIASAAELYKTQNEFIDAYVGYVNAYRDYQRISDRKIIRDTHRNIQIRFLEAKDSLLKLGLSQKEIGKLQDVSWNQIWKQPKILFFKDSGRYWVMAQVFEQDYEFVHEGQVVNARVAAYRENIKGIIRSVGGFIDPNSRSVTALIELEDTHLQMAANMLVDISIPVKLGDSILIPRQAVMDTGIRKIVFICTSGNAFEPREISTGIDTDNGFEVKSGLSAGERIVVSGNFLLDSESRVQAGLQADTAAAQGDSDGK
jgi:Cu(I)/Ag(I) efflux system membrane fusion protein